jgi:hypothetical protein
VRKCLGARGDKLMNNNARIQNLFKDFLKDCSMKKQKEEKVFNTDLTHKNGSSITDYSKYKYIFVGDNPGKSEKNANKYMVIDTNKLSSAGNNAHRFFEWLSIEETVLILNKSSIYTDTTVNLKKYKSNDVLKDNLEYMADLIFKLHKCLPACEVFITGLTGCYDPEDGWLEQKLNGGYRANQFMHPFWEKIIELYSTPENDTLREKIFITKHFAYWKIFDDIVWTKSNNINQVRITTGQRVTMKSLEITELEKTKLQTNIIESLKSLPYKNKLFGM